MPNYSGKWNLDGQLRGIKQGTWTGIGGLELYIWGDGANGRLGDGTVVFYSSPIQISSTGGTTFSTVELGGASTKALKSDGTLWAWGNNDEGALGDGTVIHRSSPVQISSDTDWQYLGIGGGHNLVIKTDGSLWSFGAAYFGGLGNRGHSEHNSSPTQVGALTDWAYVSAGASYSLAVKTDGTLWSWGLNNYGQLGQNLFTGTNRSSPVQVGALTNWAVVAGGYESGYAIKTDGTLWAWGRELYGGLGNNIGTSTAKSSPIQVGALTDWSAIEGSNNRAIALKTDGTIWAWGRNNLGQLGQNNTIDKSSPVQIGALTSWTAVGCGQNSLYALKSDGTLWVWGYNLDGQLGLGDTITYSSPVQLGTSTGWTSIASGNNSTHAAGILLERTGM